MEDVSPEELISLIRAELRRVYGEKYASLCLLEYGRGWYYFSEPVRGSKGQLKGNPLGKPMQRKAMLQLLDKLKAMGPKPRKAR